MSRDRELRYLAYIFDSIHRIEQRTSQGRDAFIDDDLIQNAVIRRLETLADATQHLSSDLRDRRPDVRGARSPISATASPMAISTSTSVSSGT